MCICPIIELFWQLKKGSFFCVLGNRWLDWRLELKKTDTLIRLSFTWTGNMSGGRCEPKILGSGLSRKGLSAVLSSSQGTLTLLVASPPQPGSAASMIWTRICCIHAVPTNQKNISKHFKAFPIKQHPTPQHQDKPTEGNLKTIRWKLYHKIKCCDFTMKHLYRKAE